ncbi:MAG: PaaI family thioesterase [Mycobacteriales bacterium]
MSKDFREIHVPFHEHLGLVIDQAGARVTMELGEHVRGPVAPVHGGVVASLVDVACGMAVDPDSYDPTVSVPVSTDLSVRFFRQPKASPLVAQATVVHQGRTVVSVECVVTDGLGRQVARGSGTYMVMTGFGPVHRAG